MPLQQILPTWLAWNNANFTSPTGLTAFRTGEPFPAGGLGLGDYFDATEKEANACSALSVGLLHWGRYRLVQVDSGATAANVQTGTVALMRRGSFVQNVLISNPGSGGTPGIYNIAIPPGTSGGSGAVIQVTVGSSGAITAATAPFGGSGYLVPFLIPAQALAAIPGLTGAVLYSRMGGYTPNLVTTLDQGWTIDGTSSQGIRAFVFLNSITPGNFGFVQELGLATVLAGGAFTPGQVVIATSILGGGALVSGASFGTALEWGAAGQLMTIIMNYQQPCQD